MPAVADTLRIRVFQSKESRMECDYCLYYEYDEEYETMICTMDLDEDEMIRFMTDRSSHCPCFRMGDEYSIVRKQN